MKITNHAQKRINQRGFSKSTLEVIMKNGINENARGGAIRVYFGNKEHQKTVAELKKAIQMLNKMKL
jgi:hypothetical protein